MTKLCSLKYIEMNILNLYNHEQWKAFFNGYNIIVTVVKNIMVASLHSKKH
jgi:hypothetical protein